MSPERAARCPPSNYKSASERLNEVAERLRQHEEASRAKHQEVVAKFSAMLHAESDTVARWRRSQRFSRDGQRASRDRPARRTW